MLVDQSLHTQKYSKTESQVTKDFIDPIEKQLILHSQAIFFYLLVFYVVYFLTFSYEQCQVTSSGVAKAGQYENAFIFIVNFVPFFKISFDLFFLGQFRFCRNLHWLNLAISKVKIIKAFFFFWAALQSSCFSVCLYFYRSNLHLKNLWHVLKTGKVLENLLAVPVWLH